MIDPSPPSANNAKPLPRHLAIIMDGNGRWAQARGLPRSAGHRKGADRVPPLVETCANLGLEALTLYSFSTENWTRSHDEVSFLMDLYVEYLIAQRPQLLEHNVRFRQLGRRDGLPPRVLEELDRSTELTQHHTGLTLCLAINYGSRAEITDAAQALARQAKAGTLDPEHITPQLLAQHLYTHGLPDPDLLIRTAGEMRLSNYLLWQLSYAELYVADTHWPDFDDAQLHKALAAYTHRTRKFGAVV
ncbi:MAG: isoprenyl transferase [Planctomycetota bacterium]